MAFTLQSVIISISTENHIPLQRWIGRGAAFQVAYFNLNREPHPSPTKVITRVTIPAGEFQSQPRTTSLSNCLLSFLQSLHDDISISTENHIPLQHVAESYNAEEEGNFNLNRETHPSPTLSAIMICSSWPRFQSQPRTTSLSNTCTAIPTAIVSLNFNLNREPHPSPTWAQR